MIRPLTPGKYTCDICIIGAGPAGLTIAAELAYSGKKICVLESGGQKRSAFVNLLKEVVSEELPIRPDSRERVVGGSSSTWGGLSAMLDRIDFVPRKWSDGWPITDKDLYPYLVAARRYKFPAPEMFESTQYPNGWGQFENIEDKIFVAVKPPYHFGSLQRIFESADNSLFTEATVTELASDGNRVSQVICKTSSGGSAQIKAKLFVLAAGGIENPRLLLHSKLGNEHDQVGRYFMNHPKGYAGSLRLGQSLAVSSPYLPRDIRGRMVYAGLHLSETFQKENGMLNSCVQMEPHLGIFQRYVFSLWKRLPDFSLKALVFLRPRHLRLRWFADMEPRSRNRIILGERKDMFGVPLPVVSYSLGERDKKTLVALHAQLKENIERLNLGKMYGTAEEVISAVTADASHHLGGTRMGLDPHTSVVNSDSKVHTISNLYVVGGSVFPTGGCANPTLTIVALSIRLAEHLGKLLRIATNSEAKSLGQGKNNIMIIGAGRRVTTDILPVLESLSDIFSISGLYARHSTTVFGNKGKYDVSSIDNLSLNRLRDVRFIYIAVPPHAVSRVLAKIPMISKNTELIIDTPVLLSRTGRLALTRFKRVHIAEDSVFLPWLSDVKRVYPIIKNVTCIQSVYRYHGMALIKALCGPVRFGWRWRNTLWLRAGSSWVKVAEPRDYARGKLLINGEEIKFPTLTRDESVLIGSVSSDETITSRMLELKRIGLRRLLLAASSGGQTWGPSDGLNDVYIDRFIHRFWIYFST